MGKNKKEIRILLADDHRLIRRGIRVLLEEEADMKVIGEAGDGREALKLLEELKPDVLVLDLMMTGMNGFEVLRQMGETSPRTNVVILSMHSNEAYVAETMRLGAKAYVLKDSAPSTLACAVRKANDGRRYLAPPISEKAIKEYLTNDGGLPVDWKQDAVSSSGE